MYAKKILTRKRLMLQVAIPNIIKKKKYITRLETKESINLKKKKLTLEKI